MTEGESYPTILVSDKSGLVLTITPDSNLSNIFSIFTQNTDVKNYLGIKIKTKFKNVFPKDKYKCFAGSEENSGKVYCLAPNSKQLTFEFVGSWAGPDGTLPPLDILQEYKIDKIFWKAN